MSRKSSSMRSARSELSSSGAQNDHDLKTRIAVIEERMGSEKEILTNQAHEYERRLQELNHSHAEARSTLATYLPRESYYKDRDSMDKRIQFLELWKERFAGGSDAAGLFVKVAWAAGGAAVALIGYFLKGGTT